MPYFITNHCIECGRCESICPTGAVTRNEQRYQINAERCNDCISHYSVPQCWASCPTSSSCTPVMAILSQQPPATASASNYWDTWFERYNRKVSHLKTNRQSDYWQRWFDVYSQALSRQLHTHTSVGFHS